MKTSLTIRTTLSAIAVACALGALPAGATSLQHKHDVAQLKADQAALQRQIKRLQADQRQLQSDRAHGKMAAVSKDEYSVIKASRAIAGTARMLPTDLSNPQQLQADEAALKRQVKRLDAALKTLQDDTEGGKMAAMSKDAEKVYKDRQAYAAEKAMIASDKAKLETDRTM